MTPVTLAITGGSGVATPAFIQALLDWGGRPQDRPELRVVLLGRSQQKLAQVQSVCAQMVRHASPTLRVEATTDMRTGLRNADYVLNQVRVGGLEARAHDETFPQDLGLPGEETIGPGGFANALRTVPVVNALMKLIGEVAPGAVVLNLTNPASTVQRAAMRYSDTSIVSICDSPITLGDELAKLVERSRTELEIGYLGMNHLGWAVSLGAGEDDLMPLALERCARLSYLGMDASFMQASRAIPLPYVRYYLYPERILAQQQQKTPRARQLQALEQDLMTQYEQLTREGNGEGAAAAVAKRGAVWYDTIVVPVLDALINDHASTWIVDVRNGETISWLPSDTIIEVPCRIDRQGVTPLPVPDELLAPELRTLLYALAQYEELVSQAIIEQDRTMAQRALVAHPQIRTAAQAEAVLAAVWPTGGV